MISYKKTEVPEELPKLFVRYWNERDAKGIASLFAPDADFVNVVGLWWHTQADIEKAHDYGLRVIFKDSTLELLEIRKKTLSENIAVVQAKMRLSHQTQNSGIVHPKKRRTIFTFVARKIDGYWICVTAHNTDIVPGSETNIVDEAGKLRATTYR